MTNSYDRWLERPYQQAASQQEDYERWCEDNDLSFDEDHWSEYEQYVEDMRTEAKIEAYEDRMEYEREQAYYREGP